ncbi:MAG: methyltransferase domain-containing protein [Acidimicrobiales bacterium]|jgi:ubiquinone/menaquinone biosynthesis C-methylase UbiE
MATDRYSHGHHESVLRSHRWRTAENSASFLLGGLARGMTLLDVGCGPGTITADLATRLKEGTVIGIDLSEEVVALAREQHLASSGVDLSFRTGDVYSLDFADATFDVVYAHQVLQHLSRPVEALEEMRRVLKPEGLLAVRDADFGGFTWYPSDPVLSRWMDVYHQLTSRNGAQADAGRHLKAWARAAGYDDVVVSSSNWTFQSVEERQWWGGLWADRIRQSEFARQCLEYGLASERELTEFSDAFLRWSDEPDAVFIVVNGEVLARR